MNISKKNIKKISIVMLSLLLLSLIPILITSFYAHTVRDDFGFSLRVHDTIENGGNFFNVISAAAEEAAFRFNSWQGTYSAIFIFALQPGGISYNLYFITTFVLIAALIFSTIIFMKEVFKFFQIDKYYSIIISSIILFLSIQFVPYKRQAYFWWNGCTYYTLFYSFALSFFTFLLKMYTENNKKYKILYFIVSIFLAAILGGGNYSTALCTSVILFLTIGYLIMKRKNKNNIVLFLCVFIVLAAGFMISMSAPGNNVRSDSYEGYAPHLAVLYSVTEASVYFSQWTGLSQTAGFIIIAMLMLRITKNINYSFRYPMLVCIITFLVFATQFTPPLYGMAHTGAGRQINMYYYSYYLFISADIFYICGWANKNSLKIRTLIKPGIIRIMRSGYTILLSCILFIIGCFVHGWGNMTSVDTAICLLDNSTQTYGKEYDQRIESIKNGDTEIEDIVNKPDFFLSLGLSHNPRYWTNYQIANYYHVDSVTQK